MCSIGVTCAGCRMSGVMCVPLVWVCGYSGIICVRCVVCCSVVARGCPKVCAR